MIGWIIWLVGMVFTLQAVYEICLLDVSLWKRTIAIVLVVMTSWVGLLFYYLYARSRIEEWLRE